MFYLSSSAAKNQGDFCLTLQEWNDWWTYKNLYSLCIRKSNGRLYEIGYIKIAEINNNQSDDIQTPKRPDCFERLESNRYISLGQDSSFYERLNALGTNTRNKVILALQDISYNIELYNRYESLEVVRKSLSRDITPSTIRGQFNRMSHGGVKLTNYSFSYHFPNISDESGVNTLTFDVVPESCPPSNIHVVIGRNAVGKTRLIRSFIASILDPNHDREKNGYVELQGENQDFSNVVCLGFSIFDNFPENGETEKIKYTYIGVEKNQFQENGHRENGISTSLKCQFTQSITTCMTNVSRYERWKNAVLDLSSDPIFRSIDLIGRADYIQNHREQYNRERAEGELGEIFDKLSSGHKIVALTITRLVETVEERSLVLLDEPELHLHPPLLSAFTRALSHLLINRNGVAVVATHSPVILQEVPRSCVWVINRDGYIVSANRPVIETFGENVGVLTSAVFKLEVTQSGFHHFLQEKLKENSWNFERTVRQFNGAIGNEALMILKMMEQDHNGATDETY